MRQSSIIFAAGQEAELAQPPLSRHGVRLLGWGIAERVDDYCATAYVYCLEPQAVPRVEIDAVPADIERHDYEQPLPQEQLSGVVDPSTA